MQRDGLDTQAAEFVPRKVEKEVVEAARPRLPCNVNEEEDWYEQHDDYHEHQRNDEEEIV